MKRPLDDASQEYRLPPPRDMLDLSTPISQDWSQRQYWESSSVPSSNDSGIPLWSQLPIYENEASNTLSFGQGISFEQYQVPFEFSQILQGSNGNMHNPSFDTANSQNTPDSNLLSILHSTEPSQSPTPTPQSSLFAEEDTPAVLSDNRVCFGEVCTIRERSQITC